MACRTGNSKQDDLLVGPLLRSLVRLGDAAGGYALGFLGPGDVAVEATVSIFHPKCPSRI